MDNSKILMSIHKFKNLNYKFCQPIMQRYDMTKNEIDIMLFLSNNQQYDTAHDIVEIRGLTKSHVSKSIESLVQKKFLSTYFDKSDRRVIHLTIEDESTKMLKDAHKMQSNFFNSLLDGFSNEEIQHLYGMLNKVIKNMNTCIQEQEREITNV